VPVATAASDSPPEPVEEQAQLASTEENAEVWRDRALRLQAEMENFRKRQRRLAEERVAEEREGAQVIDPQGEPFDPEWHEAVGTTTEHGAGVPPYTVVEVLRPGYRAGDRLLRPVRVLISA
jgi:molecular chaperone GrpE (heat shock protein)